MPRVVALLLCLMSPRAFGTDNCPTTLSQSPERRIDKHIVTSAGRQSTRNSVRSKENVGTSTVLHCVPYEERALSLSQCYDAQHADVVWSWTIYRQDSGAKVLTMSASDVLLAPYRFAVTNDARLHIAFSQEDVDNIYAVCRVSIQCTDNRVRNYLRFS